MTNGFAWRSSASLDRLIPLGERHLRHALAQFVGTITANATIKASAMSSSTASDPRAQAAPFTAANIWVDFSAITIVQRDRDAGNAVGPSYRTLRGIDCPQIAGFQVSAEASSRCDRQLTRVGFTNGDSEVMNKPKIYISYVWLDAKDEMGNPLTKDDGRPIRVADERGLKLADQLRAADFDARLDLYFKDELYGLRHLMVYPVISEIHG
jgi:hypothetical protein